MSPWDQRKWEKEKKMPVRKDHFSANNTRLGYNKAVKCPVLGIGGMNLEKVIAIPHSLKKNAGLYGL